MATRTELLDAFEAALNGWILDIPEQSNRVKHADGRSHIVEVTGSIGGGHTVETHITYWWDNDVMNKSNKLFFVVDPGTANEAAAWIQHNDPKPPAPEPTFQQEMDAWLNSKLDTAFGSLTLRHVESTTANNALERGTASVIVENSAGEFVRMGVALWRAAGEWQLKVITE